MASENCLIGSLLIKCLSDLQMVCKFKLAHYVHWFKFDSPSKSEVYDFIIVKRFVNFQALDPKFHFALEPTVLKLPRTINQKRYSERPQDKGLRHLRS